MPGAMAPAGAGFAPGGTNGMGSAQSGYAAAQQNLMNSLNASNNTTSSQQMQLGKQLQQNQGNVQQMMTNRGLGNTTIAGTMSQVPLQTYNQGMAQVQNQGALRQMQAYGQLANLQAAGGQSVAQMQQPYAQTAATMGAMQSMKPGPQSDFNASNAQGQMLNGMTNLMNMQNWQQNGYMPGQTGYGATIPGGTTMSFPSQQQASNPFMGLTPDQLSNIGAGGSGSDGGF